MIIIPKGYNGSDILTHNKTRINMVKASMKDENGIVLALGVIENFIEEKKYDLAKNVFEILFYEEISNSVFNDFVSKIKKVNLDRFIVMFYDYYKLQGVKGFTYNTMTILMKLGIE